MIPNLNPNDLVIFCVVARERSLSSAAEKLSLTQPAVTYHIQSLEKFTRVKLIEVKRHQVILTPQGQELFKYAEDIYERLVDAERYIRFVRESNLRVGIASVYDSMVMPLLQEMFDKKDTEVKLTVKSGNAFEMVQDVVDATLDLAIVPRFDYPSEKLKYVQVSNPERIVLFGAARQEMPAHPLSWEEIGEYPLVMGPEASVIRRVIFDRFRELGLMEPELAAEVGNVEWCRTLVENGKGVSFTLVKDIEEHVAAGRFKLVPLEEYLSITADAAARQDVDNPIINTFIHLVQHAFGYDDAGKP